MDALFESKGEQFLDRVVTLTGWVSDERFQVWQLSFIGPLCRFAVS